MNENIKNIFGFNVGETLYIAHKETGKVYKFVTDCIKIHAEDISVHGLLYGLYSTFGIPKEYNLKYLNKRYIFVHRREAKKWLDKFLLKTKKTQKCNYISKDEVKKYWNNRAICIEFPDGTDTLAQENGYTLEQCLKMTTVKFFLD